MSMHIKSPAGTPDIPIGSVRVKPSTTVKTITENGVYNASTDNVEGYSLVTVNVAGGDVPKVRNVQVFNANDPGVLLNMELKASDGTTSPYSGWYVSPYIDVMDAMYVNKIISSGQACAFYDDTKTCIWSQQWSNNSDIPVPQNAKYFRFNAPLSRIDSDMLILRLNHDYP